MRVVKHPPAFKEFGVGCRTCGAELQVETEADLFKVEYQAHPLDHSSYNMSRVMFTCPCCREDQEVSRELVPDHVLRSLVTK
jgi:hypothetical protein